MYLEWFELSFRAFDDGGCAIDQIQYVHAAVCVVLNRATKSVATGFYELVGVQTGSLFFDTFLFMQYFEVVCDFCFHEGCGAFPLYDVLASLYVYGAWFAVESETSPVPKLEGEDAWCAAYLENHAVVA